MQRQKTVKTYNKNTYKKRYKKLLRLKKEKKPLFKWIFILTFCVAALVAIFFSLKFFGYKQEDNRTFDEIANMEASHEIPYIVMKSKNNTVFNKLYAIKDDDIKTQNAIDSFLPIDDDRKQKIVISAKKDEIKSLKYRIREAGTNALVEEGNGIIEEEEKNQTNAVIPIKNLISPKVKYKLQIIVDTNKFGSLSYNTVFEQMGDVWLDQKIAYVNDFISKMYNPNDEDYIFSQMLPQLATDASNMAVATYKSMTANVMFKKINPRLAEKPTPTVARVDKDNTKISVSYPIYVQFGDLKRRVIVNEAYSVRMNADGKVSLNNFDRKAFETIEAENIKTSKIGVQIGLYANRNTYVKSSDSGHYAAFTNGGNLWLSYDGKDKKINTDTYITRVFSFDSPKYPGEDIQTSITVNENGQIERLSNGYEINVLSLDDNGDMTFTVYGMFRTRRHLGYSGIGVYKYKNEDKSLQELVFVPIIGSLEDIKKYASSSALNTKNQYYLIDGENIVKFDTKKLVANIIEKDIVKDNFSISKNRHLIAYMKKTDRIDEKDYLRILNIEKNKTITIKPNKDEKISLIGFLAEDLAYRIDNKKIVIVDENGSIIKEYFNENMTIENARIVDGNISFDVYENGIKKYDDKIFSRSQTILSKAVATFVNTPNIGQLLYIVYVDGANINDAAKTYVVDKFSYSGDDTVFIPKN